MKNHLQVLLKPEILKSKDPGMSCSLCDVHDSQRSKKCCEMEKCQGRTWSNMAIESYTASASDSSDRSSSALSSLTEVGNDAPNRSRWRISSASQSAMTSFDESGFHGGMNVYTRSLALVLFLSSVHVAPQSFTVKGFLDAKRCHLLMRFS